MAPAMVKVWKKRIEGMTITRDKAIGRRDRDRDLR